MAVTATENREIPGYSRRRGCGRLRPRGRSSRGSSGELACQCTDSDVANSGRTSPPPQPPWYTDRPRLRAALEEIVSHRLTTVVAGAGYGKTSLLSAWATDNGAAWLSVERGDRAPASLVPSMASAVQRRAPEFAIDPAAALGGASEGESADRAEVVAASLLESIEHAWRRRLRADHRLR